ncbi:MAG: Mth938-like domain-containing protein [Woeseiaceae bacterium]|nr:Mth938-like domain-containing protein [Woeseiaceae bacterium]
MSARLVIRSVSESAIRVNDDDYVHSIALTPEAVLGAWSDKPVAELVPDDFATVFDATPEVVLLGTGPTNLFPPRELMFAFARKGIGFEVMDTPAAARTFNVLANEGRRVAAVLCIQG